jgi:hypothetical protein
VLAANGTAVAVPADVGERRFNTAVAALIPAAFWAPFILAHLIAGANLEDASAHFHPRRPQHRGRHALPNALMALTELGLLTAGWWRFRTDGVPRRS